MILESLSVETKILNAKRRSSLAYGMVSGLAFAIAFWGGDGYLLSQSHGYFPWTKFIAGGILTTLVGGLAGWLVQRVDKIFVGLFIWFAVGGLYSWFSVLVPINLAPKIIGLLEPKLINILYHGETSGLSAIVGVSFAWVSISFFIVAIIQIPMIEQSVFSAGAFGRIIPHIIAALLMISSGSILDNLQNKPLRDPILSLDQTIQFSVINRGRTVDPEVARELHAAALRPVEDLISPNRRLLVSHYDKDLDTVNVWVNFNGAWADCKVTYTFATPLFCQPVIP